VVGCASRNADGSAERERLGGGDCGKPWADRPTADHHGKIGSDRTARKLPTHKGNEQHTAGCRAFEQMFSKLHYYFLLFEY
jgi:hypothetical protein